MIRSTIRYSLMAAAVLVLAACASPASREGMTPAAVTVAKHFSSGVQVKTSGGVEAGGAGAANIMNDDFKAAIEAAVTQSRLFKTVVQGADGSDYELTVQIVSLAKPLFGTTFTVNLETAWSLVKTSDRSVAMRKSIQSTGVATVGEAFVGATRIRLAVERAANEGIAQGLQAIAELKL